MLLIFSCLPAAFLKKLESCYSVEKGKRIVLRCEVVDPNTQVKWLKNGQEIKPSAKYMNKHMRTSHMITLSFGLLPFQRAKLRAELIYSAALVSYNHHA